MRLFTSGSAPLLAATHVEFRDRTGFEIVERYGMTETLIITSNPLDSARKPGSVGIPLPGMQVKLDGEDVLVSGPSVLSGYWNRPEINDTEFTADGYFKTGDVGRIDEDGYLHLVGRSKDLVISGGLNVYPIEVETVLDAIDGVLESAVIGVPDADFGEAVTAVVVLRPGATTDEATIRAIARKELATFKVPKRVHIVADLPRNTMGKVEKATLRRTYAP
jgi:malonyl-CoA/methylmalonyl-CoA synthetase